MKKLLAILLCIPFILGGCSGKDDVTKSDGADTAGVVEEVEDIVPETDNEFYNMANSTKRPVAVMIDNDSEDSRPQIGPEHAFLVYEIIVEGGATRMMALFKNHDIEKVGPVRSSRHYFLDYALENDAIYAHAGWSPQAERDIPLLGVDNINGILGNDGVNFWRDNTYDNTWHNLYTSVKKLTDYAKNKKSYPVRTKGTVLNMSTEDVTPEGTDCTDLTVKYSNMYSVKFKYNAEEGVYERSLNGKPHVSHTGEVFSAKNIIVYDVANYTLDDGQNKGRQDIKNIGTGKGWYVSLGKAVPITWKKDSRESKTVYSTEDGKELEVNPGITYIQIIPKDNPITMS